MGEGDKTEIGFYQLRNWPLERALPRLLERASDADMRVVVRCGSKPRLDSLDRVTLPVLAFTHGRPPVPFVPDRPVRVSSSTRSRYPEPPLDDAEY